jgi:biopolymer transport protein ExbD
MPIGKARLKITDYNEQRKKTLKGRERKIRQISLSLTSMVDMFAILVIFLLTSSGTVSEWMQLSHDIKLPAAKYAEAPRKATTLQISLKGMLADGAPLELPQLADWLKQNRSTQEFINVVGDERVAYGTIQKVVATCRTAGYSQVNLATTPTN